MFIVDAWLSNFVFWPDAVLIYLPNFDKICLIFMLICLRPAILDNALVTGAGAGSAKFPRVLTVAAGAALVASSVGAATRTRTGLKKELR